MTHWGTNTYLLGTREIVVIDPGPDDPSHRAALLAAIGTANVTHILVTHAHGDHSLGAPALSAATGAPVLAYGAADAGRSPVMAALARHGALGGGEGVDAGFAPDHLLSDTQTITVEGETLTALHTPGHFAGHLAFALGDTVFTGDLVMGWASTLISPPDGDLGAFMASCARLRTLGAERFLPGHGAVVIHPSDRLDWLIAHRRDREAQILDCLALGPATPAELAARIYHDQPPALRPAAARNVFAHLIDLAERNRVSPDGPMTPTARFTRI
jgi:glyoxylase-like metal-dependent hydrolase (beta-lactamase superfamily II)